MVDRSYMLGRQSDPSAAKRYVDQHVIPAAIDAAGCVESVVERVAVRVRRSPALAIGIAFGAGFLLSQAGRLRPA